MQCLKVAFSLLLGLVVSPAVAQNAELIGAWCDNTSGERMFIEQDVIGFNEHTICQFSQPLMDNVPFRVILYCNNIYFDGEEQIKAFPATYDFLAESVSQDILSVTQDSAPQPQIFTRCEE